MNFPAVDAALQAALAGEQLAGVSYTVFRGSEVLARKCLGWADREAEVPLREDHLFRAFSNTKLVTSCAALQMLEQGRCRLDDPVGQYIPALANLRVLRPGATAINDTEPAREPVRIRHLLTHTAGFTYAFTQPDAPIAKAYRDARILDPQRDLAQTMEALGTLPLLFQPGSAWNYSVATDVVGRLVEVLSGQKLDDYFRAHVFAPLGMRDTFFAIPPEKQERLAALYIGSLQEPLRPGLRRADNLPYEGAWLRPMAFLGGGGGLVTSLGDYAALVRALLQGGAPLLRPETMELVTRNQLPEGMWIQFPGLPVQQGRGHSLAGAVVVDGSHAVSLGEGQVDWGGLAGTKWAFSPREGVGAVLMTQRYMGSDLPYWPGFLRALREDLRSA
ncbi:beta-lactamase family protein [Ramlibacter sp. USB13]|uniref:Beta-lactamase family protein n=1 Tax=Ramlibacter cellulosilyticus TaxID=2764187 RepID=A0A923SD02_9BURK|nr:serine hydrolase domain-containing protein [Ramlibacter cellulosilyticus]MBC5781422.1 beta-lactamase family protein [Ramlibacter cellulosilyticus]